MTGEEGGYGNFFQQDLFIENTNSDNSKYPLQIYIHLIVVKSLFGVPLGENKFEH